MTTPLLAGLFLLALPAVTRAQATLQVTNCNDRGPGSLRRAVASAASGDIVDMTALSCGRIELTTGPIAIAQDDLRLQGPGRAALAVDGNDLASVLRHTGGGTLHIERLSIEHGKRVAGPAEGGCIYSRGSLDLRYVDVRHCTASGDGSQNGFGRGAGIYVAGNANVLGSLIHANVAQGTGSAGGGIFARGALTLDRSTISNNRANRGGGVYAMDGLTTDYSSISDNRALTSGGIAAQGDVTIADSIIASNRTDGYAAGIDLWGSGVQLIVNSTVSGNQAGACFSGVRMGGAESTIANSTIAFNEIVNYQCGYAPGAVRAAGLLHLQSTIIAANIGRYDVGGDRRTDTLQGDNNLIMRSRLALPPGTLTFDPMLAPLADNGGARRTHALLEGSPAVDRGNNGAGLAYDQRGPGFPRVRGPQADIGAFEGTVPPSTIAVTNCNDAGAGSLRDAVARVTTRGTVDLSALTCGTITLTTGAIQILQDDLILQGPGYERLTISGNDASSVLRHVGTGTFEAGTLRIRDLTVAHGRLSAEFANGGCIGSRGSVEITNSQVHHCVAESTGGGQGAHGGGIDALAQVSLTTSAVFANAVHAVGVDQQDANGGGIHAWGGLKLDRSVLCDNVADDYGGGATTGESTPPGLGGLTIDHSTVCRNTAGSVAAIDVYGGPVSISNSTISENRALDGFGGVVVTGNGQTMISNSTFSGNSATRFASALYFARWSDSPDPVLNNSTIAFNDEQTPTDGTCYGAVAVVGVAHLQSNILGHNTCGTDNADLGGRPQWGDAVDGADNLIMSSSLPTPADTLTSDPRLAPLADNGGRTHTHGLLDGSPAIDAGNNAAGLPNDQRGPGYPRVKGTRADMGAYER